MQSFCPVGEIGMTLSTQGVKEAGDNREGDDGSSNKVGDAEREGVIHDGETVGNFEECIDERKEGITVGAELKHDGETVGILEEYFDGLKEGTKEGT